jgi:RNA polymerase sigma factor (sigma-70 family)
MSDELPPRRPTELDLPSSDDAGVATRKKRAPLDEAMYRWSHGDKLAGNFVVEQLYPGVDRWVRRHVADPERARDIVQDVFLSLTANAGRYIDGFPVKAWVYRMATNRCKDHHKQAARRTPTDASGELDLHVDRNGFSPEEYAQAASLDEAMRGTVRIISDVDREAFELIVDGHMTVPEAAAFVDCGENAMKFRWHRARQAILAHLPPWLRGDR